ncbi:MAG: DegV family protein [Erysipelotrichaceae bacterium]|nr:DegV family protein [Erysipelotrichaceae bacterium]
MQDYIISCCSTADLTKQQLEKLNVNYICFHFELDGKQYYDDLGQSVSFSDFYNAMAQGKQTKTSQVNCEEYEQYFRKLLKSGKDILHISFSSGLSGSYNSARLAVDTMKQEFPDRKIYLIDSLAASCGYGLLVDTASELREKGYTIEENYRYIEENKLNLNHWFFSTDLSYYVKGGRISKTAGFIGQALNICPLLDVNDAGKLIPREKIRTKKKVIKTIVDKMQQNAVDGINYNGKCFISHSNCLQDAQEVASLIEERFKNLNGKVQINYVGTTIGSHTGPGTVALFFYGKKREN